MTYRPTRPGNNYSPFDPVTMVADKCEFAKGITAELIEHPPHKYLRHNNRQMYWCEGFKATELAHENSCSPDRCRWADEDCPINEYNRVISFIESMSDENWEDLKADEDSRRRTARDLPKIPADALRPYVREIPTPQTPALDALFQGLRASAPKTITPQVLCFACNHELRKHNGAGIGVCTEDIFANVDGMEHCGCDGHPNNVLLQEYL